MISTIAYANAKPLQDNCFKKEQAIHKAQKSWFTYQEAQREENK